jgi:hypothetical protein
MCPSGSEEIAYLVNNSSLKPSTPDVTLYNGPDESALIIGVSHLTISGTNTIGVGDYSQADSDIAMVWETLHRTGHMGGLLC